MAGFSYLGRQHRSSDPARLALLTQKQDRQRTYVSALKDGVDPEIQGLEWAAFAAGQADLALRQAWHRCRDAKPFVDHLDPNRFVPGLFILGLGKLGGRDLNFSSDIDLVAFYDATTVPVPEAAGRTHVCSQVLRRFIQLIDGHKDGAFVWRTDWRLRPDPSVTDLALSAEAGLDYFHFQSAPWRRLALLKARVVAGDVPAGQHFLRDLHSFIWRRNLDFSMVEEIAQLKHRIHLEHPSLADARRVSQDLGAQQGFHLKLGRGGIRDIEFLANAQQLLWGGRHSTLQTPHTQTALTALGDLGLLEETAQLRQAYGFFRTLENAVQAYADRQVHALPQDPQAQAWLGQICKQPFAQILDQAGSYRALVARQFDALFPNQSRATPQVALNYATGTTLGLNERRAIELNPILHRIDVLAAQQADPGAAVADLHAWLARLKGLPAYLSALQDAPALAELALRGFWESPLIAHLLGQTPLALDSLFLRGKSLGGLTAPELFKAGQDLLAAAPGREAQLAALRTWINESLYLIYLALLDAKLTPERGAQLLAKLAEGALDLCAEVTASDLDLPRLPFTILAMGRLGLGWLTPGSDLDLIFVLEEGVALESGNRAVSRFVSTLNARLAEGRVYEIDTRLRPSGTSGPPILTFASFVEHQRERAKTWEHLALSFMRPLKGLWHGSEGLQQRLFSLKQDLLRRPREQAQWLADCQLMFGRLLDQRIDQPDQAEGEVKLAAGGLLELEYILAAVCLRHGNLSWPEEAAKQLKLSDALVCQRQALIHQRLLGPAWQSRHAELAKNFAKTCRQVRQATFNLLGPPEIYPKSRDHEETAVKWVA